MTKFFSLNYSKCTNEMLLSDYHKWLSANRVSLFEKCYSHL